MGEVGYYSPVGIIKFTTKPNIKIKDLDKKKLKNLRESS